MYKANSALEVEDLTYAVRSREELICRQLAESTSKNNIDMTKELKNELGRLSLLRQKLESHQNDHDYPVDFLGMFPEIFTD